jgi:hypothetical protein
MKSSVPVLNGLDTGSICDDGDPPSDISHVTSLDVFQVGNEQGRKKQRLG